MMSEIIKAIAQDPGPIFIERQRERAKVSQTLQDSLEKAWDEYGDSEGENTTENQMKNVLAKTLSVFELYTTSPVNGLEPPKAFMDQLRDAQNLNTREGLKAAKEFFDRESLIYNSDYYQEGPFSQQLKNEYKRRAKACRKTSPIFCSIVIKMLAGKMKVSRDSSLSAA